jgi:tricorn protease
VSGRWAIENEGVAPDIEVENTPAAENAGHDLQLERAVQEALKLLERNPPPRTPRPGPPNRTQTKRP